MRRAVSWARASSHRVLGGRRWGGGGGGCQQEGMMEPRRGRGWRGGIEQEVNKKNDGAAA